MSQRLIAAVTALVLAWLITPVPAVAQNAYIANLASDDVSVDTRPTLDPVRGDVWINHGKGFQQVHSRIEAEVGNSIMVDPAGYATLTYADGCEANVKPGAVMTVARLSPCASGSLAADVKPPIYTKAPAAAPAAASEFAWWPFAGAGEGIGVLIANTGHGPPPLGP